MALQAPAAPTPQGSTPADIMRKALSKILLFAPAHASTLSKMKIVERADCPSMRTDGRTIEWGPEFVGGLTWQEIGFVLCHEVDHRHLAHNWRFGHRDALLWNVAGDARINADLISYFRAASLPFTMPKGGVNYPWVTSDMTTEQIYAILEQKYPPDERSQFSAGFGGGPGERDMTQAPVDASEADAVADTATAAAIGQSMGTAPAHLGREVKAVSDRMVDWRSLLSARIRAIIGADDWGYRRARTSGIRNGVILPTLHGNKVQAVTVCIDTSGSHWHLIDQCFAEVKSIFEAVNPSEVFVLQGDTELCAENRYTSAAEVTYEASGGGGSDFRQMLERAREIDAVATVFITDGDGNWPAEPVPNLITVLVGHYGGVQNVPYGDVVEVRE